MADSPRIVFMGTPDFAVPSLDALVEAGLAPVAVVTVPDKPAGRGQKVRESAVKQAAARHGLPIVQPVSVKDPAFAAEVDRLAPEILVVVAFQILPPAVYETARLGAFNLHGSLLPAYRGAAPLQRALMDGVEETGVTTFFLQQSVDTGNVILRRAIAVGPDDTAGDVHDRLAEVGAEAVVETVRRIAAGTAVGEPQDDTLASPAPKIFREDGRLDWTQPAVRVHNHVRALAPVPGAWTEWDGETLKILQTTPTEGGGEPGAVTVDEGRIVVACGEGAVEVLALQRQGKRRLDAADFLNGVDLDGARFGA
ncbi:methionyl-tRNA formyltransferase [Rubrivirga sp. IMCC45206]|uniref:methionyl-tRNA formyltransferase n=1 Tax=Rubrivirga sp. IMCC45206 TaxID=3391614 RepID=UPI0039903A46